MTHRVEPTIKRAIKWLFSLRATVVLIALIAVLLGIATFVEHSFSTKVARLFFYNGWVFYTLLLLAVANLAGVLYYGRFLHWKKTGMLLFHIAFVVILLGAWTTRVFAYDGLLPLQQGIPTNKMLLVDSTAGGVTGNSRALPFTVELERFVLKRYPGSNSPSSFESFLILRTSEGEIRREHIYMNKIAHAEGFRLYQSSYDEAQGLSILSINYDPIGSAVSYIGYALLLIGCIIVLFGRGSRFATLIKQIGRPTSANFTLLLLLLSTATAFASLEATNRHEATQHLPSPTAAAAFGRLLIQSPEGRIEPINSYSEKLLRKLSRKEELYGFSADQLLLGIILYPEYWNQQPLLANKNKEVARRFGLPEHSLISFASLFDSQNNYILGKRVEQIYASSPRERTSLEKEILKLDEKANIIHALQRGRYLSIIPLHGEANNKWFSPADDMSHFAEADSLIASQLYPILLQASHKSISSGNDSTILQAIELIATYQQNHGGALILSDSRISGELIYNRLKIFDRLALPYVLVGLLLIGVALLQMFNPSRLKASISSTLVWVLGTLFIATSIGIGLRWYVSAQPPFSNAYETMVFVAWTSAGAGLLFARRSSLSPGVASLMAGVVLFVAHLNFLDPQITPLVPVLKSPWLMIHVAVVTAAYGFFGICFLLGIIGVAMEGVCSRKRPTNHSHEIRLVNEVAMTLGLFLMTLGTFLGAVWANQSWGRYWGWDPKETWALITMLAYALVLHARFVSSLRSDYAFNALSIFAFASVLMTYFGVNYYLSGLHSYGTTGTPPALDAVYWVFGALLGGVFIIGYRKGSKDNRKKFTQRQ